MADLTLDDVVLGAARAAHEAIVSMDYATGHPAALWEQLEDREQEEAQRDVHLVMKGQGPVFLHTEWLRTMLRAGWQYGPVLSAVHKRHPELVVWDKLPAEAAARRQLWVRVVQAFVLAADAS